MKKIALLLTGALLIHPIQAGWEPTPSQKSVIVSGIGSVIILAPVWLPFMGSKKGIDASEEKSKQAKKIKVKDQNDEEQILVIPEEIADQVDVKEGEKVQLDKDENGVLLIKNDQPAYYFITPDKTYLFEQKDVTPK